MWSPLSGRHRALCRTPVVAISAVQTPGESWVAGGGAEGRGDAFAAHFVAGDEGATSPMMLSVPDGGGALFTDDVAVLGGLNQPGHS